MTTQEDRGPLSTEISISETEVDPQELGRCGSRSRDPNRFQAEATTDERLSIGARLSGRYRIERELGEGGMGAVYLVSDQQVVGEVFAVKVLKGALDPQALQLLREEVRQTRKLSHPNIVGMHSVNVDGKRLYVLMEYLEGKSLNALLDEEFGRGITFSHAWPIIEDVGAAVGYAHDHNVIHSDLKPANIFLTTSGKTKLLDFGIARVSRGPLLHKRSGPLALTPAYASCEMLEGKEADARDDIYSFACVIYEMLCGKRPFGELTALEARDAGAQVPPLAVLSQAQNEALAQALAFDRTARTPSVEQLLAGLATDKAPGGRRTAVLVPAVIATLALLGFAYLALDKLWISRRSVVDQPVGSETQPSSSHAAANTFTFAPPPHSIAVLPFVNISGDKEQEYFSDGLTEELLISLAKINELQVAARTSSFYFKGEHADLSTIAHKLNVASVLEGSVRRTGNTIRITAQLNNAVTGFQLWSQTYDRDLSNVLQLQTEIASAVANALKVTVLGDVAAEIEVGGTRNPEAFDAYLRASKAFDDERNGEDLHTAISGYSEAIHRDPDFALAYARRSLATARFARNYADKRALGEYLNKAQADARKAIALAPDLADGHVALAKFLAQSLEFILATQEYERALALAPGTASVLASYGVNAVLMGRTEAGLAATHRSVVLDPLNSKSHSELCYALIIAGRYRDAVAACRDAQTLDPHNGYINARLGFAYYYLGDYQSALTACQQADGRNKPICLAIVYDKILRHADAEAILAKMRVECGDNCAVTFAFIYLEWGDTGRALDWLETMMRLRDPYLIYLKADRMFDPLRKEPRFQAIERELKFPD
jgi:serine/threonine-protein kinase